MPVLEIAGLTVNLMDILIFIFIGFAAGWIATRIVEKQGYGVVGNTIIGIIGSVLGGYVASFFSLQVGGQFGKFIIAAIGAVVLVFLLKFIKR